MQFLQVYKRPIALLLIVLSCKSPKMSHITIIILALVISVVTPLDIDPKLVTAITESCKLKFPNIPNYPTIEDTMAGSYSTSDHNVQCFIRCFGQTAGIVTKNGKLVMNTLKLMKFSDEPTTIKAVTDCDNGIKTLADNRADKCETAYMQWRCFLKGVNIV